LATVTMLATTVEKRARQRANKLKSSASTSQASEINSTPIPQTSTSPPFDFDFFIRNADIINIHGFLTSVSSTADGQNLKLLWERAFAEGKKVRQEEEYDRGFNAGYNEGYSDAGEKDYEACEKFYEAGLAANASVSTTEVGTQTTIDASIQDSLHHSDVSTQTSTISIRESAGAWYDQTDAITN
jgi:hypothetical protein